MMQRPTLTALRARILGDLAGRTEGKAYLRRSVESVLGVVVATVAHGLYGAIEWAERQQLPGTADEAALLRWGQMLGVLRTGGTRATGGTLQLTGTPGTRVTAGTAFRASSGAVLSTLHDAVLTGGMATVEVIAREPGAHGNTLPGDTSATAITPVAGMSSQATLTAELLGGADLEDLERYRARVVEALRKPPRAGGPGDYRAWALEVPGVAEAWEYPHRAGVGTVSVAIASRIEDADGNVLSRAVNAQLVADVQAHLDETRPLDMRAVYVVAPIARPVDMTIALVPNTQDVRAQVEQELRRVFAETAPNAPLSRSLVDEAISTAPGEASHEITSITNLDPGPWGLLTLGTLMFTGAP